METLHRKYGSKETPLKKCLKKKRKKKKNLNPSINFSSSLHCNGDTIRIGQGIQCLLYARLFLPDPEGFLLIMNEKAIFIPNITNTFDFSSKKKIK